MHRHLLVVFACLVATPVLAQERLELLVARNGQRALLELDLGSDQLATVRALTPIPQGPGAGAVGTPFAVAGGRYVVWTSAERSVRDPEWLQIFDRQSRTTGLVRAGDPFRAVELQPDPLRPRVFSAAAPLVSSIPLGFGQPALFVYDLTTGISRGLLPSRLGEPGHGRYVYAARADQIVAWRLKTNRFGPTWTFDIAVLDVASGAIVRTFPIPAIPSTFAVTEDGRRLYAYYDGSGSPIVAYDLTTGLEIGRSAPFVLGGPLIVDDTRGLLLVPLLDRRAIAVVDAATLVTRGVVPVPPGGQGFAVYADKTSSRVHVVRAGPPSSDCLAAVDTFGPDGRLIRTVDIAAVTGGWRPLNCNPFVGVLVNASLATVTLTASVTGTTVGLAWDVIGDAGKIELQIGLTPDAAILRVPLDVNTRAVSYGAVPPGVYYARVVTVDAAGVAASSNQVRIEVR